MEHLEGKSALELVKDVQKHGDQILEIEGERFVVSLRPVLLSDDEDENSRLLAERYIEANPDIRADIERADKAFEDGRFFTLGDIIEQVYRGER